MTIQITQYININEFECGVLLQTMGYYLVHDIYTVLTFKYMQIWKPLAWRVLDWEFHTCTNLN
jgi:hypothetical protein